LFNRNGSKITLTVAGDVLLNTPKKYFEVYRDIDFDMNTLISQRSGLLRIGASTTISQYIIPPLLARFHQKLQDIKVSLLMEIRNKLKTLYYNKKLK
jgi:DNA-binding transcriptional LysR family regulator